MMIMDSIHLIWEITQYESFQFIFSNQIPMFLIFCLFSIKKMSFYFIFHHIIFA